MICYEQQLEIAKETGERVEERQACENLGHLYFKIANFKLAAMRYKCAVYIAEEIGDKTEISKAKRYLGNCHYRNGRFENAIKYHRKDLKLAKELGDKEGEGIAYGNLGDVYFSLGEFLDEAERWLRLSKKTFDNLRKPSYSNDEWVINIQDRYNLI